MLTLHRPVRDRPDPRGHSTFDELPDRSYGVMT